MNVSSEKVSSLPSVQRSYIPDRLEGVGIQRVVFGEEGVVA
jgi:hypothetical protein